MLKIPVCCRFAIAFCVFAVVSAHAGVDLFVSMSGDDANAGTVSAPFKTLTRAKQQVRALIPAATGPVRVFIRQGTYYLDSALVFSAQDGGTAATPITWSAYRGEKVVLSGGMKVNSTWTVSPGNSNIMVTTVSLNLKVDQLFLNGKRQILARYPNLTPADSMYTLNGTLANALGTRAATWSNPTEGPGYIRATHSNGSL